MEEPKRRKVRRMQFVKSDFETHGYTVKCPGCFAVLHNLDKKPSHWESCRTRMEEALAQSDAGRARLKRQEDRKLAEEKDLLAEAEAQQPGTDLAGDQVKGLEERPMRRTPSTMPTRARTEKRDCGGTCRKR